MDVRRIQQTINCDANKEYESFDMRERLMDYSCSYQVMVYPKYMILNKTSVQLLAQKQVFEPFSNNYLNVYNDKTAFKVPGYKYSDNLTINTVGMAGILAIDLECQDYVPLDKLLPG